MIFDIDLTPRIIHNGTTKNMKLYKITYRGKFIFPFLYLRFFGFTKWTHANNEEEVRKVMWKMPFISNSANLNNYQVTVEEDY